jgi:hypothetical protein
MGVNVTTRTVWFAVCQHCTRRKMQDTPGYWNVFVADFASKMDRAAWQIEHHRANLQTHPDVDYVVWDVTTGDPVA